MRKYKEMECYYCKTIRKFYINIDDYKCTKCGRKFSHAPIDERYTTGYSNRIPSSNVYTEHLEKDELQKEIEEENYTKGFNEVKDRFIQQKSTIYDSFGTRWIQCELCGDIKQENEFVSYGGTNHLNLGKCRQCARKEKR